jgi:DNA-binding NarL/FixJ family response regulator
LTSHDRVKELADTCSQKPVRNLVRMETTSRPRRVAIADDSPDFLAAAATYVETLPGFTVAGTARTAPQILELVEKSMPDVLLVDLRIASERGIELLRQVKAARAALAVVALTLFESPQAAEAARRAGADAVVGKTSFIGGLARTLERLFPSAA